MLEVTHAEYLDGHRIRVRFSNDQHGVVDLAEALWGPMFLPLKDPAVFRRFEVSELLHTICWENDADLAPEYLYDLMIKQSAAPEQVGEGVSDVASATHRHAGG
jgi:hypothetical protein